MALAEGAIVHKLVCTMSCAGNYAAIVQHHAVTGGTEMSSLFTAGDTIEWQYAYWQALLADYRANASPWKVALLGMLASDTTLLSVSIAPVGIWSPTSPLSGYAPGNPVVVAGETLGDRVGTYTLPEVGASFVGDTQSAGPIAWLTAEPRRIPKIFVPAAPAGTVFSGIPTEDYETKLASYADGMVDGMSLGTGDYTVRRVLSTAVHVGGELTSWECLGVLAWRLGRWAWSQNRRRVPV